MLARRVAYQNDAQHQATLEAEAARTGAAVLPSLVSKPYLMYQDLLARGLTDEIYHGLHQLAVHVHNVVGRNCGRRSVWVIHFTVDMIRELLLTHLMNCDTMAQQKFPRHSSETFGMYNTFYMLRVFVMARGHPFPETAVSVHHMSYSVLLRRSQLLMDTFQEEGCPPLADTVMRGRWKLFIQKCGIETSGMLTGKLTGKRVRT
jgi:hypothetical protein